MAGCLVYCLFSSGNHWDQILTTALSAAARTEVTTELLMLAQHCYCYLGAMHHIWT